MKTPTTLDCAKLTSKLDEMAEGKCAIALTQVDPDALASAFAMRLLMRSRTDKDVPIFYAGSVAHPQNRCVVNRYDLLSYMRPFPTERADEYTVALVDSSKAEDGRGPTLAQMQIAVVVDHHRGCDIRDDQAFVWVEEVGACSTLMAEILYAAKEAGDSKEGDAIQEIPREIRVMLALGIYTDTKALISASKRDREAYAWLTEDLDHADMNQFIEYPLPDTHFQNLNYALSHMTRDKDRIVATCGVIETSESDDLSTIADYMLRMSGVTLVVVWAIVGGKVRVSARNRDLTTPLDQFLKDRLGSKSGAKLSPDGRGEGGAMLDLDLGLWLCEDTLPAIEQMVKLRLESLIFTRVKN